MRENTIDKQYQALLQDILDNGYVKKDRTGTGTISVYGRTIRHKMSDGFPLLTTKKMYFKGIVTELLWFLRGDTNIKYLLDNDCHIWDGDALKNFNKHIDEENAKMSSDPLLMYQPKARWSMFEFIERIKTDSEFAAKWGDLGPIYGKQWRSWGSLDKEAFFNSDNLEDPLAGGHGMFYKKYEIDQIADAIHKLKTNPDDRGIIVSAWNVGELDQMVLRPCHNFFQFYTRELSLIERGEWWMKNSAPRIPSHLSEFFSHDEMDEANVPKRAISLMWNQRSVDTPLGLPFNIASYALLLEIVGKMVNMVPDELIGTLGDTHIYLNQVDSVKEQLTKEPYELPTLKMVKTDAFYKSLSEDLSLFSHLDPSDFTIENYQSHPTIKYPLSN